MTVTQLNPAQTCQSYALQAICDGASLPMFRKNARDGAEINLLATMMVAEFSTRENSNGMTSTATPNDVCNSVFRYPSPSRWSDDVPFGPPAPLPYFVGQRRHARGFAETLLNGTAQLRLSRSLRCWRQLNQKKKGTGICATLRLQRYSSFLQVALRPAVTHLWNKACLALGQGPVRPLSQAVTQKQPLSSVALGTWRIARPIQAVATDLNSAALERFIMNVTTKAFGFGGFLLPTSAQTLALTTLEGTSNVRQDPDRQPR